VFSVVFQNLEYCLKVFISLCDFLKFSFYLSLGDECFFRINGFHLLLALPSDMVLDSCQLGSLVIDLSFHRRYLIGQKSSLILQPFFLRLHLPVDGLFDRNVFFPETIQGLDALAVDLLAGRFARFLELLTLGVDLLIHSFNNCGSLGFELLILGVDLLIEITGLSVELLLHGFNESGSLGFEHLFHLRTDLAWQNFYLVGQP